MRRIEFNVDQDSIDEIMVEELKCIYHGTTSNLVRMGCLALLDYHMTSWDFEQWSKGKGQDE